MLARSKLNSIENKMSKALTDNEISHEDFETIINEEKKYRELKESIRMMNSQRSDAEKVNLIEEGKKWVLILKNNENIKPRVSKTSNGRTMLLSKCAICNSKKSRFNKN